MELPRFFMTLSCANLAWDELKSTVAILCRETCSPSALTLLTVKLGLQYLTWRLIPIFLRDISYSKSCRRCKNETLRYQLCEIFTNSALWKVTFKRIQRYKISLIQENKIRWQFLEITRTKITIVYYPFQIQMICRYN